MKHSDLLKLLQNLELKWNPHGSAPPLPPQAGAWVRCKSIDNGNIQYFACSRPDQGLDDLPVVVDVGVNYTQGTRSVPGHKVEDAITNSAEKKCIDHCNGNRAAWEATCLCSPTLPNPLLRNPKATPPVQDFHLVATNFSPWITTLSWQKDIVETFSPAIAADILAHPPHPLGPCGYPFGHLDELYKALYPHHEPAVWIGHGLEAVAAHFRLWTRRMNIRDWMITGNLGRPPTLSVRPAAIPRGGNPRGGDLVKFGKPRKKS